MPCSRCRWWCRPAWRPRTPASDRRRGRRPHDPRSGGFPNLPGSYVVPLCPFDLYQEALELGRVGIRVDDRRAQAVHERPGVLACVFLNAAEALMDRNADLVDLLAVDGHRLDAARHESFRDVVAAGAGYLHLVAALDADLSRQR